MLIMYLLRWCLPNPLPTIHTPNLTPLVTPSTVRGLKMPIHNHLLIPLSRMAEQMMVSLGNSASS